MEQEVDYLPMQVLSSQMEKPNKILQQIRWIPLLTPETV